MIKLCGAILIILSSTWLGLQFAQQVRQRPEQIRQLLSALSILEMEIQYGNRPLTEICQQIAKRTTGAIAELFLMSAKRLQQSDHSTFTCFQQVIFQIWRKTALKTTEQDILLDFCATLGRSDRQDQQQHIQRAKEHLRIEEEKARYEQKQYEKMFRTMGVLGGVLVVILLY